jgi:hypothetical protein
MSTAQLPKRQHQFFCELARILKERRIEKQSLGKNFRQQKRLEMKDFATWYDEETGKYVKFCAPFISKTFQRLRRRGLIYYQDYIINSVSITHRGYRYLELNGIELRETD